jgi:hypothetical protein
MPTQTKFICPSGESNVDLSGIFADLDGGTSYGTATKFKVGSVDLTGYFHASTSSEDRPSFNTGFKVNGTDLSTLFRRRGFSGLNITVQPQSVTKNEGDTHQFSITATTTSGTLTYQWKKWNGSSYADISGATSSTYTTPTLTASDDGNLYRCTVSNGTTTLDSSIATLTVYYVTITDHPDAGSFNAGDSPVLGVTATVKPTTALYQWQYSNNNSSWVDEGGATNSTLTLSNINSADEGYYRCRVTNNNSSVTEFSNSAYIQVYYEAVITSQPSQNPNNQFANGTNDVSISISANGKSSPTFQWQESTDAGETWANLSNTGRISGATTNTLTISDVVAADDDRLFKCLVTNNNATGGSFGTIESNEFTLSIYYITITTQPTGGTVNHGDTASFSVEATSNPNSQTYQWQYSSNGSTGWTDMGDAVGEISRLDCTTYNERILSFTARHSASNNDGGYYRCVITAGGNSKTSNNAQLTVNKQQFTLTVNNGTGGGTENFDYQYTITADDRTGDDPPQDFSSWSVVNGNVSFADSGQSPTTCTISADSTVEANYV